MTTDQKLARICDALIANSRGDGGLTRRIADEVRATLAVPAKVGDQ